MRRAEFNIFRETAHASLISGKRDSEEKVPGAECILLCAQAVGARALNLCRREMHLSVWPWRANTRSPQKSEMLIWVRACVRAWPLKGCRHKQRRESVSLSPRKSTIEATTFCVYCRAHFYRVAAALEVPERGRAQVGGVKYKGRRQERAHNKSSLYRLDNFSKYLRYEHSRQETRPTLSSLAKVCFNQRTNSFHCAFFF